MEFPWRVKQRQADEHLRRFEEACTEYIDAAHVGLRYDRDPVEGTIRVSFQAEAEPPMSLGAIIGDILHNLRSALDSVAWETCRRAGVPTEFEKNVYFPIGVDAAKWDSIAKNKLPHVAPKNLEVFRQNQPWYRDEEARAFGVDTVPTAARHPLVRLDQLAKMDRHRVPHPVLARLGDTWLAGPEGVEVQLAWGPARRALPGEVVLEWRIDPREAVSQFSPSGDAILVLNDDAAQPLRPAVHELRAMQQAVIQATRSVEIEVLEVVTSAQLDELDRLWKASQKTERDVASLSETAHVIDADYIERYGQALAAAETARTAYLGQWRELFE